MKKTLLTVLFALFVSINSVSFADPFPDHVNNLPEAIVAVLSGAAATVFSAQGFQAAVTNVSRVGFAGTIFAGATLVATGLKWFYDQAMLTNTSLDTWYNMPDSNIASYCTSVNLVQGITYSDHTMQIAYFMSCTDSAGNTQNFSGSYFVSSDHPINQWTEAEKDSYRYANYCQPALSVRCPTGGNWSLGAHTFLNKTYEYAWSGAGKPSLDNWISGNYPGGTPHPDARQGIKTAVIPYLQNKLATPDTFGQPVPGFSITNPPNRNQYDGTDTNFWLDSDGDGFSDGQELRQGSDPANAVSTPPAIPGSISDGGSAGAPPSPWLNPDPNRDPASHNCVSPTVQNHQTGACDSPSPACPAGQIKNASGTCIPDPTPCPSAQYRNAAGSCVPEPVCTSPNILDPATHTCVPPGDCAAGQFRNSAGVCVPDPTCDVGKHIQSHVCVDDTTTNPNFPAPALPVVGSRWSALPAELAAKYAAVVTLAQTKVPFGFLPWLTGVTGNVGACSASISVDLVALGSKTFDFCSDSRIIWARDNVRPALVVLFFFGLTMFILKRFEAI